MKKYIILALFLIMNGRIAAQLDFSVSMGLDFKASPSFRDYVNSGFGAGSQMPAFKSSISFSGEADYKISKTFALGVEYDVQIDSYNNSYSLYEISYTLHRPSILAYYVISGSGYQFKIGGGAGPRFVTLSERISSTTNYTSAGAGMLLKAEGNTMLGGNFYALIGVTLRYDLSGDLSNSKGKIINGNTHENMNLNTVSGGVYLGLSYLL